MKPLNTMKTKYSGAFSSLSFFPFIRLDNYNTANTFWQKIKPGVYVASNDMLNRYSIFAGAALNIRLERDLFFIFEYKNKLPLLSLIGLKPELSAELYSVSRKNSDVDILSISRWCVDTLNPLMLLTTYLNLILQQGTGFSTAIIILNLRFIFSRYTATLGSFIIETTTTKLFYYPNQ